jgi:hypothetical protein
MQGFYRGRLLIASVTFNPDEGSGGAEDLFHLLQREVNGRGEGRGRFLVVQEPTRMDKQGFDFNA